MGRGLTTSPGGDEGVGATLASMTPASRRGPAPTDCAIVDHVRSTISCFGNISLFTRYQLRVAGDWGDPQKGPCRGI